MIQYCTKSAARGDELGPYALQKWLVHKPAHADVHDNSEREEGEENRRSAVTHERKGDSRNRHQTDDHPYVDRNLKDDDGDDAHDDEGAGQVGGCLSVLNQTHQYKEV